MKTILIAATLMAGTAAWAQPPSGQQTQPDVSQPGQADASGATQPPTSQEPIGQPNQPVQTTPSTPNAWAPTSSRGAPPARASQMPGRAWGNSQGAGAMQARTATGTYQRCTRQLRDNCVQREPR